MSARRWVCADPETAASLCATVRTELDEINRVERPEGTADASELRYFRLVGRTGACFVKAIPESAVSTGIAAEAIARGVRLLGVGVCTMIVPEPLRWTDGRWLFVYPWVEAATIPPEPDSLRRLGFRIAQLHGALRRIPSELRDDVASRSDERVRWLLAGNRDLSAFAERLHRLSMRWAADHVSSLSTHPWAVLSSLPQQVIHGDLNAGNVLWREDTEKEFVFLDFEEATRQYLPTAVDLALAFERIVLDVVSEASLCAQCLDALFNGYAVGEGEAAAAAAADGFRAALDWNLLTPLTILADFRATGRDWPDEEWEKFHRLADMHVRFRPAMEATLPRWRK
ncbi:phosphotransferase enzyme family protein [Minwuia thermotolerans]|uniref:Aminoglycoside phosphotransferase domain-containing protein n=1 Tax=Minwuia thermotolerans TaxID=2056226 RepID=A0A2M9G669_9PROT|nr:phosphotransferase [Minwuia thermotolerans]PJK31208.1 hypothetical protein CVT23_02975 [Minwuia thermotolerans]